MSQLSAQNESNVLSLIHRLDAAKSESDYVSINTQFEQLAATYPKNWLALYYTSLGYAFMSSKGFDLNEVNIDKSIKYMHLTKALSTNDEVFCLESFVYSIKMSKAPFSRWLAYKSRILHPLEKAEKLNPDNPRIYILQASIQKNIPTWLGGGCIAASKFIKTAVEKWANQQMNTIQPHWGGGIIEALKKACPVD